MSSLPLFHLDGGQLRLVLPLARAIDELEKALGEMTGVLCPPRTAVTIGDGQLLTMPAAAAQASGVKVVTLQRSNPARGLPLIHSVYILLEAETLAPVALLDGGELTRIRTAAVSGLATRYLALPDARRLLVFGAGVQAEAHVEAMAAVRAIEEVRIVARSPSSAQRLADHVRRQLHLPARPGSVADVPWAQIVCTCTTSPEPLFPAALLAAGAHVNAVGSYQPHTRELDSDTVARASVFVDDQEAALGEAGDLLLAIRDGRFSPAMIAGDLRSLVLGERRDAPPGEITLFKSVGAGWQDLMVASAAWGAVGRGSG